MQLQNFQIGDDNISLIWQEQELDLHNCYDFQTILYTISLRQIALTWLRSPDEWARNTILPGFMLIFKDVSFFQVKAHDINYSCVEDNCLLSVSFHPVELRDEFDSISLSSSPTDDLTFYFQSEWGFKINASMAELLPLASL